MHIPTFVFIFILFLKNILLLLLYPKHVTKLLGYNLGCYKPYVVSYSKRHLELRNINYFQFVFDLVEFVLVDVLIVHFLMPFYIVFLFEEI